MIRRLRPAFALSVLAAGTSGCGVLLGLDDFTVSNGTGGSMSSSSSASSSSTTSVGGHGGMTGSGGMTSSGSTGGAMACAPASTMACYTGAMGTENVGACKGGTQTCANDGSAWGACLGEIVPAGADDCANGVDATCDNLVTCACVANSVSPCYDGGSGTMNKGTCVGGMHMCDALGKGYGACVGEVTPLAQDDCSVGAVNHDTSCDGTNSCVCVPGTSAGCYSGVIGTSGKGTCHDGTKLCDASGLFYGACSGEVTPTVVDDCTQLADTSCDGVNTCVCLPNSSASCYSGMPANTAGVGNCKAGMKACNAGGTAYGACVGEVGPQPENCSVKGDEDCNGNPCSDCLWSEIFGDASPQAGAAIGSDALGNVYETGWFQGSINFGGGNLVAPTGNNSFLVKLDAAGAHIWSKKLGTSTNYAPAGAVDSAGNIAMGGSFQGTLDVGCGAMTSAGSDDIFVAKFNSTGICLWSKRFGNAASNGAPSGIALDASGNVTITGAFAGAVDFGQGLLTSAGGNDIFVAKLLAGSGTTQWAKRFGDAGQQYGERVACEPSGNIFVTGEFAGTISFGGPSFTAGGTQDVFLVSLDPAGAHNWTKDFVGPGSESVTGLAVDPATSSVLVHGIFDNTISLGGNTLATGGSTSFFLGKLSVGGAHQWSKSFSGSTGLTKGGRLAVDSSGNVLFGGEVYGTIDLGGGVLPAPQMSNDSFLAKFDGLGTHLWSKRFIATVGMTNIHVGATPAGEVLYGFGHDGSVNLGTGLLVAAGGNDIGIARFAP